MRGKVYRKALVLGIILLFVGASIIPSISGNIRESISVKDVDHFDDTWEGWAPEQINEAGEDKKYEFKHSMVFSKDDLVFNSLMEYDLVELNDGIYTNEIGKPMLPAKQIKIALPAGMEAINVRVIDVEREELPGTYDIFPAQQPLKTGSSDIEIILVEPETETYTSSSPYPSEDVKLVGQTDLAGQGMAIIQVNPLQYIPVEKKLILYTSITFVVTGVDGYECGSYLSPAISDASQESYERMVKGMVINPEDVELKTRGDDPQPLLLPSGQYDYIIIAPNGWTSNYQPLADWKTKKGVPAKIVTLNDITNWYGDDGKEEIRDFIIDANDEWGSIYFLLGADTNYIPYHTRTFSVDPISVASDTYYACLGSTTSDWTCDVHVGRVPARNIMHVTNFVNKI